MKKFPFFILAGAVALAGCHSSHKNPAVAATVEREFMQRWVDQRTHDYMAQGKFPNEAEARSQAMQDFRKQYRYTTVAEQLGSAPSK